MISNIRNEGMVYYPAKDIGVEDIYFRKATMKGAPVNFSTEALFIYFVWEDLGIPSIVVKYYIYTYQ